MAGLKDIGKKISDQFGLKSGKKGQAVVEAVFAAISDELANGEKVSIRNFGVFKVKDIPARTIKSLVTEEMVEVPASKRVLLTVGKALKAKVNGYEVVDEADDAEPVEDGADEE